MKKDRRSIGAVLLDVAPASIRRAVGVRHDCSYLSSRGGAPDGQSEGLWGAGLDQFSYGEVEVTDSTLTITPKGIDGSPLVTDDGPCGPFVLNFQP